MKLILMLVKLLKKKYLFGRVSELYTKLAIIYPQSRKLRKILSNFEEYSNYLFNHNNIIFDRLQFALLCD